MNRIQLSHLAFGLLPLSMFVTGCSAEAGFEEEVNSANEPIIRGEDYSRDKSIASGLVYFSGGCTASLINNTWAILAAHCVPAIFDANNDGVVDDPTQFSVGIGNTDPSRQQIALSRIVKHPNGTFGSSMGTDVALVRLSTAVPASIPASGQWSLGRLAIYPGTGASLLGAELTVMGYGCNTQPYGNPETFPGLGILRQSRLAVTSADSSRISVRSVEGSGLTCNGDSGGPMFLDDFGSTRTRYLVGVHSTSSRDTPNGSSTDTVSQAFRDWVEQTVFGTALPITWSCSITGTKCSSRPTSLPDNARVTSAFVPYGAKQNECYDVKADYNMENRCDYVTIAGTRLTGTGSKTFKYCGALPVAFETDGSVPSAGVTLTASNHTHAYECNVDIGAGTTTCSGAVTMSSISTTAKATINMAQRTKLYVSAEICNPQRYVLNLGDSVSNDGGGGDAGDSSNDAEIDLQGTALRFFGRDGSNPSLIHEDTSFLATSNCTWRNFQILDGAVDLPDRRLKINNANLLRLNQPTTEGSPDAIWYLGINRVVSDSMAGSRNGSGVRRVLIRLE